MALPYPSIDPVAISIGPLAVRWYGLAYATAIIAGYWYIRRLISRDTLWSGQKAPAPEAIDDLLLYSVLGIIVGGRLGHVLFYEPAYYFANPLEIIAVWKGGMSFHGGFVGTALAALHVAHRHKISYWTVCDLLSAAAPIGIALGRLANFINAEVVGSRSSLPWAMVFPGHGPEPRHPAMLYEAALEGVALFLIVYFLITRKRTLRWPGLTTGYFLAGYAAARIFCEFFKLEGRVLFEAFPVTKGMLLSLPMLAIGLWLLALRRRAARDQMDG